MILSSNRIQLRPWRTGDEVALVRYANNRKVAMNLRDRFPHPYTETDARNWISIASQGTPLENFAIELLPRTDETALASAKKAPAPGIAGGPIAPGEAIGGIGLILGEDVYRRSAEVGYWIGEPFWGQGIVTEALTLLMPYAFRAFSLTRVFAGVFETNPASVRALEKAGFALESRMRKAVVKDNQVLDALMYVMIQ
jgi:ribosomal-protein-alanine N-acetyltransferase